MNKKLAPFIATLALLLISACTSIPSFTDTNKIPYPSGIVLDGPAGVDRQFDIKNSPYYPVIDFFNMKSHNSLTILEHFKTFQQTTETTCGPACVLMVLEYYGKYNGQSDRDIYEFRENKDRPESMLKDLIRMFESNGEWDIYSTYDLDEPSELPEDFIIKTLRAGKPIIFGDGEWGVGHWRIIIGYDDMGDDIVANDVLVLAEPYDTNDHNQDGYTIMSFERLYYNWTNQFDPDFSQYLFLVVGVK